MNKMVATWVHASTGSQSASGCGKMNLTTTTREDGNRKKKWQARCKFCGRKKNLNTSTVRFYPLTGLNAAKDEQNAHNVGEEE